MTVSPTALYQSLIQDLHDYESNRDPIVRKAIDQLKASFLKKYEENTPDEANRRAIEKFLAINVECGEWAPDVRKGLFLDELVGTLKEELHKFFEPENRSPLVFSAYEILHHARTGPGATLGANGTDFYTKLFSSHLSYTSEFLKASYAHYVQNSPIWSNAEKFRQDAGYGFRVVSGNRLSCVPKNVDISRTICTEPSLNVFFQLGLGEIITRRLRKVYNIDLATQPDVNRELARLGSIDGRFCTIDLESASDSMSLRMLEYVLPKDIFRWLCVLRSPQSTLPDGQQVNLNMVSTMGNGFTFPLQTTLFSCVVSACLRYFGIRRGRDTRTWSVFGDDIIVPTEIVGAVLDLLDFLGFKVNMQKSFFEGPFRESCGRDYFYGYDVRGVYVKRLHTQQDRVTVLNRLNHWSATTGIYLPRVCRMLLRSVRYLPVPVWDNDDAGVKVPSFVLPEVKYSPEDSILYRRFVSHPKQLVVGEGTIRSPRGHRRRIYNPDGLLWAFLHGSLVSGRISIRHNANLYRTTVGVAPNWEYSPAVSVYKTEASLQRWRIAVWQNLWHRKVT